MRTAVLSSWLKKMVREILGPLLPLVRSVRTLPARHKASQFAEHLSHKSELAVCYLTTNFPIRPALRTEIAHGGAVKLTFLAESFPHAYPEASLLYTVSSVDHIAKSSIVRIARDKGLKVVLNQNGVAYPAWHGRGWEEPNRKMKTVLEQADFIIYQSEFCRLGAEKFLGSGNTPSKIIYNPVDINLYQPKNNISKQNGPILLLGGNQYEKYRFESAIKIFSETLSRLPDAKLIITGKLWGENQLLSLEIAKELIRQYKLENKVEFTGTYSQGSAMQIFRRADILIHTKYNDPSPNLIPEALASGIPIVYSASGGVPELVGKDAGVGIPVEQSWERINLPDSSQMSAAILRIWENLSIFSDAARQRAVDHFDLNKFVRAHREIFSELLD